MSAEPKSICGCEEPDFGCDAFFFSRGGVTSNRTPPVTCILPAGHDGMHLAKTMPKPIGGGLMYSETRRWSGQ